MVSTVCMRGTTANPRPTAESSMHVCMSSGCSQARQCPRQLHHPRSRQLPCCFQPQTHLLRQHFIQRWVLQSLLSGQRQVLVPPQPELLAALRTVSTVCMQVITAAPRPTVESLMRVSLFFGCPTEYQWTVAPALRVIKGIATQRSAAPGSLVLVQVGHLASWFKVK
jgi:hypothetical protein